MYSARVIPVLLLCDGGAVKTQKFQEWKYIGDPVNAARIYSDSEVDELIVLDIEASKLEREPDFDWIEEIASEAFMPLCYGGGVQELGQMQKLFRLGVEKVALNSALYNNQSLLRMASEKFGKQAVVASLDVTSRSGQYSCLVRGGGQAPSLAQMLDLVQEQGAGEILLTSVEREGTQVGYDLELVKFVKDRVSIPWILNGGAGKLEHIQEAQRLGAKALAAGSLFVFQGRHQAVLINYPTREQLVALLS